MHGLRVLQLKLSKENLKKEVIDGDVKNTDKKEGVSKQRILQGTRAMMWVEMSDGFWYWLSPDVLPCQICSLHVK